MNFINFAPQHSPYASPNRSVSKPFGPNLDFAVHNFKGVDLCALNCKIGMLLCSADLGTDEGDCLIRKRVIKATESSFPISCVSAHLAVF